MERILEQEYFNETGKKAYETLTTGNKKKIVYTTLYKRWAARKEGKKPKVQLLRCE